MSIDIRIQTIAHESQRYPTVGDYIEHSNGMIQVFVSEFGTEQEQFAVALHELIELQLCKQRGIKFEQIDAFDMEFEAQRTIKEEVTGEVDVSEPGWDPKSPYHKEHVFAELIERQFIREAGINWPDYDKKVNEL